MDEPKYKIGAVARAAGISVSTLKNWERKERQLIRREEGALFTFRRALQVALTAALVHLRLSPDFAARTAFGFTDIGDGELPGLRSNRDPGEMFENGWTVICIYPGEHAEVKNVQPADAAVTLFTPLGHARSDAVTLLNVTFLAQRLREALEG